MAYVGQLIVLIDSVSQVELTGVQATADGRKIPINTKRGLTGFAQGAKNIRITFDAAIPLSGPEFDPMEAVNQNADHTVTIPYGPKSVFSVGQFTEATLGSNTDDAAKLGFQFMGTFPAPK